MLPNASTQVTLVNSPWQLFSHQPLKMTDSTALRVDGKKLKTPLRPLDVLYVFMIVSTRRLIIIYNHHGIINKPTNEMLAMSLRYPRKVWKLH